MKNLTLKEATDLLIKGEVVAIPTETVYGLAADALSHAAVSKIFKAKGRPADNPLIVHIGHVEQVEDLVTHVSKKTRLLMAHFWPGPLTLILPSAGIVSHLVTAGLTTVGVRMPSHNMTLKLLRTSGIPLAAPSANLSGKPSPTSVEHVKHDMHGRIPGVIDGGVCEIGLESTVIDMTSAIPIILRPGGISKGQIEAIIGRVEMSEEKPENPKAPGMKYTHYSPNASVYLVKGSQNHFEKMIHQFKGKGLKVGVLCLDTTKYHHQVANVVKSVGEKGQNLYAGLRALDEKQVDVVLCEFFDDVAVMNRLLKASEERILNEVEN